MACELSSRDGVVIESGYRGDCVEKGSSPCCFDAILIPVMLNLCFDIE
jgi:hypothetical protein